MLLEQWVKHSCLPECMCDSMQPQRHGRAGEIAAAGAGAAAGGAAFAASRAHNEPQRATAQGHPIQVIIGLLLCQPWRPGSFVQCHHT